MDSALFPVQVHQENNFQTVDPVSEFNNEYQRR
jgi:hypothetical protein